MRQRGHVEFCHLARRNEQYYMGGGEQWTPEDRDDLENRQQALPVEMNDIWDAVNTAGGYQLSNRMDIQFRPRANGATEKTAKTLSQVAMQICDNNQYPWKESQVFLDGLIQQRGYFEIRIRYNDSLRGEVSIDTLDPLDVIPDPDAKSYDPDDWADVIITRWLTLEEVETMYGARAAKTLKERSPTVNERDFGDDMHEVERNKFGEDRFGVTSSYDAMFTSGGITRVRIIDRQHWKMVMTRVMVTPSGDIRIIENATPEQINQWRSAGNLIMRRMSKRVRWTVSTQDNLLHDAWSPFNHFTVVPYFPIFRRGKTRGMVDNARSPQDVVNKTLTKELQIVSGTANSGWIVEENSLTNMDAEDLEANGAKNGLTIEYSATAKNKPEKIKPNDIPNGIDHLANLGAQKMRAILGVTDSMRGEGGKNQAGVSVQAQQYAGQMSLALPLDNLARSRHLLAVRMLEMIQAFYDEPRIFQITKTDRTTGRPSVEELRVNWQQGNEVLNNLTAGEYDVVIVDQPTQITFDNSQFQQCLEIEKVRPGTIPPNVLLRYSNLADKSDIIDEIMSQPKGDPVNEAKALLLQAQTVQANIQSMFSAIRTGQIISMMPQVAGLGDQIAKSAGFVDQDPAPIFPTPVDAALAGPPAPPPPENTNPSTPDHAARGAEAGIEAGPQA